MENNEKMQIAVNHSIKGTFGPATTFEVVTSTDIDEIMDAIKKCMSILKKDFFAYIEVIRGKAGIRVSAIDYVEWQNGIVECTAGESGSSLNKYKIPIAKLREHLKDFLA